ncbi:MAG: hypothetical protein EOO38_16640 [Cytophagaceae bacterium]|nr:MAG: hypothetical protein EOO38_16640 [Cytophagaceae bacterium]
MSEPIFNSYPFGVAEKARLDHDGHILLPALLTEATRERLVESLGKVTGLISTLDPIPQRYSAEYDEFLASIIAHPQMVQLARSVLGDEIRYDHCVDLSRAGSSPALSWHTHGYADDQLELGFIRIFFYVNGFKRGDGNLRVVPGSHHFREGMRGSTDDELYADWLTGKTHLYSGEPLEIEELDVPVGSVIVMWTHALHAVAPRLAESPTRWAVVYAYRNPGAPSHARWISPSFEENPPTGAEGLMSLY